MPTSKDRATIIKKLAKELNKAEPKKRLEALKKLFLLAFDAADKRGRPDAQRLDYII